MKISMITTCFNREKTIADAVRSVLEQNYDDIEYIIVDGASTDNTVTVISDIISRYPGYDIKFISEPDSGIYEAINKGIRLATGDYIGLCHSDDMLYSGDTLSRISSFLEETKADFLYAEGVFVNPDKLNKVIRRWYGGKYARWKVRLGWLPLHPTCYIRRDVYFKCGLYDETYKIAADTKLLVDYLYHQKLKVCYFPENIIRMRMGGMSTDASKRKEMWKEDVGIYSEYGFKPAVITKILKMLWKVPQFIAAKKWQ